MWSVKPVMPALYVSRSSQNPFSIGTHCAVTENRHILESFIQTDLYNAVYITFDFYDILLLLQQESSAEANEKHWND